MRLVNSDQALQKPLVWIEINTSALLQNVHVMKKIVGPRMIMAVVKANAYGLGAVGVAKTIEHEVDYFGVVGVAEAISLRNSGIKKPIVNLGIYCNEDAEMLIAQRITPSIFTTTDLQRYSQCAQKRNTKATLWIKVETGLGRLGVPHQEALTLIQAAANNPDIVLDAVYSTFTEDRCFDRDQFDAFLALKKRCEGLGIMGAQWSIASSQAAILFEDSMLDTVRLGISLLGYYPSVESKQRKDITLRPCATYKTRVACIKELEQGESIFYRRTFIAKQKTRIAVLLPGYSYGLSAQLANGGAVLIRGKRYPLVGGISATNSFADIGLDTSIEVNDEVVFFGAQGEHRIDVEEVCTVTNQSVYECLSRIPEKVGRMLV